MDMSGDLGNTGIPKKIAIPAGAALAAGGFIFWRRYKAAKAASQTASSNPSNNPLLSTSMDTPYGPTLGNGPLNVTLPPNAGLSGKDLKALEAQNTYIIQALQNIHEVNARTAVGVAALANVNPGALQVIQQTGPTWETAAENQTVPWPVPATSPAMSGNAMPAAIGGQ